MQSLCHSDCRPSGPAEPTICTVVTSVPVPPVAPVMLSMTLSPSLRPLLQSQLCQKLSLVIVRQSRLP